MADGPIGMGEQDRAERDRFENELKRITRASEEAGLILRVIGSLAFQMHCPKFGYVQQAMGRVYTDIDFAAYRKQFKAIKVLMAGLGYTENKEVFIVSEGDRAIFNHTSSDLHVDIFYDKLDFSHMITWNGRLEVDSPTIPLAEMLRYTTNIRSITGGRGYFTMEFDHYAEVSESVTRSVLEGAR